MGRRVSARPLAAPSGFARTLLRLCFAKLLASLVGGPDGFAAGASRAQATRRLPARANDARPRIRLSRPSTRSPRLNLKLRALGLPLPLRGFAMFQRQFSASKCRLELPSAGLIVMSGQAESRLTPAAASSVLCRSSSVLSCPPRSPRLCF